MTHAAATVDQMRPPYPAERGLDVYNTKLGMWVFLASEVMFFAALIGTYVILRFGAPGEWAKPGIVLNIKITAFNTFLLICSRDRKSTRLNSSHLVISYAVFCLKKKK